MSLLTDLATKELANLKPEDIVGALKPIIEKELASIGSQDLDGDKTPDYQEALAAAEEIEQGVVKLVGLVKAYKAKYLPKV